LDLFKDGHDFMTFLIMLRQALLASGSTLWAFTLMSNHYHLIIHASSEQLTGCMRRVNRCYSRYHNAKYGLVGHAFDGPYKAYAQPTPILLLRTIAYVFMNPVTAGISSRPEEWAWSSVRDYLGLPGSPFNVDPRAALDQVSKDPTVAWAAFHRAMEREAMRPKRVASDTLTRTQVHAQQFEWLLEHARESEAQLAGEDPILMALHWGRQCGISPKAMSSVLSDRTADQISQALFRFSAKLKADPARRKRLALP